jgi:ATP-dependent exoDNAse (exonuclease V) beta subunit
MLPVTSAVAAAAGVEATGQSAEDLAAEPSRASGPVPTGHERVVGTLVHRLFQRQAIADDAAGAAPVSAVLDLLSVEERVELADPEAAAAAAWTRYQALRRQPELATLLASGQAFFEVPFSYRPPDDPETCLRGLIDCLVVDDGGAATVVEFKTGAPRPEHRVQAELYRRAVAATGSYRAVGLRLFYV